MALNGVAIYGQSAGAQNSHSDAVQGEASTFDKCGGHGPDQYHYHIPPICLLDQLGAVDTTHSPQIVRIVL